MPLLSVRIRLLVVLALAALSSACGPGGPAVMEFTEIVPAQPRIGEVVTVRFRLLDSRGLPMAGQRVDFKLQNEREGVSLSPTSASSIKGSGYAETQLVASGRVNSVIVVATAGDREVLSPPITFAGTVPSARQFTFQCGDIAGSASGGRHAIGAFDQSRTLIAGVKIDCTAHTGDRNGDGVGGALISFMVEAGTVGPTETTSTDIIGNATILYKTSLPLPQEVPPETFKWSPPAAGPGSLFTGAYVAPLWMHPFEWVENPMQLALTDPAMRTYTLREPRRPDPIRYNPDNSRPENNPRDNLVTMIAVTSGEEAFIDNNNNGTYDEGEPFDDLTEPFVDSNDDGTWTPNERYIDVNGNKLWDGGNGRWDGATLIWVQERLLWTGVPAMQDSFAVVPNVTGHRPVFSAVNSTIRLRCPAGLAVGSPCYQAHDDLSTANPPAANAVIRGWLADPWFNALARNSDGDGCALEVVGKAPVELKSSSQLGTAFTYPSGEQLIFEVGDSRDPNVPPLQQIPKRGFPISFSVSIICSYTASPKEGHIVKINLGNVTGDID